MADLKQAETHPEDSAEESEDRPATPFFSRNAIAGLTSVILLLSLYVVLTAFMPAQLDIKADPAATVMPAGSKPDWYFLAVSEFLRIVRPPVGRLLVILGIGFLILVPWTDRNPERSYARRPVALALGGLLVAGLVVLSVLGALE
ncbi:MAG: hypothetical protein Q8K99_14480 [Actinomycetota bacterium]|nr:hypothetical protein [Actinomycetota bacterium]